MALPKTSVVAVGIDPPSLSGHAVEPLKLPIDAPRDALQELAIELRADAVAILPAARLEPALVISSQPKPAT